MTTQSLFFTLYHNSFNFFVDYAKNLCKNDLALRKLKEKFFLASLESAEVLQSKI